MDTRKRIFNIGFIGEDRYQREIILSLLSRNLKEKEKSRQKMNKNPKNFVINNLSNGHIPLLSLVKTPGDVKYFKNTLSGCFVSDYLIFIIPIPKESSSMEIEFNHEGKYESFIRNFQIELNKFSTLEILKYTKKPSVFLLIDADVIKQANSVFKAQDNEKKLLTKEEKDEMKHSIIEFLRSKKIYTEIHSIFLQNESFEQKLEKFIWEELLTKRIIVRLKTLSSTFSRSNSINTEILKNETKELEDIDQNILKVTKIHVFRAYKNYETGRLVLFSKVISGALEACSLESYWITNNFDKKFRFDDIQIGGVRVSKCVAGEVVALSFKASDVFPFFLRKSIVFENDPFLLGIMEKGVQVIKAKLNLFQKNGFSIKNGTKFSIHFSCIVKGVQVVDVLDKDEESLQWRVMLYIGNLGMMRKEDCDVLGSFAILEKQRFLGYGEVLEISTG